MCLVSFVPLDDYTLITSNRDESIQRQEPQPIQTYKHHPRILTYPKDVAGGTWIAHDDKQTAMVLLNGGFENHRRQPPYRKSRGLIFLELLSSDNPQEAWSAIDLDNIEPFTLIYFSSERILFENVWDGRSKTTTELDPTTRHFWMSTTLYQRDYYKGIKATFMSLSNLTRKDVFDFHNNYYYEDNTQGFLIPQIRTVSVSTMQISQTQTSLVSKDLRMMA